MVLISLFISFLQVISSTATTVDEDSSNISSSSIQQAEYYITQVEAEKGVEENLWALTLLGSANSDVRSFVEEKAKNKSYSNWQRTLFQEFDKSFNSQLEKVVFETASPNLLIALLLSTESQERRRKLYDSFRTEFGSLKATSIDYSALGQSIINSDSITTDILPNDKFYLPHFFLLFDNKSKELFSDDYRNAIIENWKGNLDLNKSSLRNKLQIITYFRTLYLQDQYAKTASLYNDLVTDNLFPNSSLKLSIYRYLDFSMYQLGYYDRSLQIVRKYTLPLVNNYGSTPVKLQIKIAQATYLYNIGKVKEAQSVFENTISIAEENGINLPESIVYNNLALAYFKTGQYNKYLELQFQALETAEEQDNYSHQLEIYKNLFVYYRQTENSNEALNYLQQAEKLVKEEGNKADLGNIYTYTGSFYRKFKQNFDLAHEYYNRAEKILDYENNSDDYINLLLEQGEAYEKQNRLNLALKKHNLIVDITPQQNNPIHIDALVNKALINLKMGNLTKAKELINNYKSYNLNQLDFQQIIKAKTVEADYLHRTGNPQEAINILLPALDQVVERAQSSADLQTGFWHVEEEYLDAFDLAVNILKETNNPERAIQLLDQLKTINDASLYQNPLVKSSMLNESELSQYKQLTSQLDATRKKLLTAPENQHFEIQQTINKLKLKKETLDKKLTAQMNNDPISVRKVQNRISGRELVMHITELNNHYYIAKITRSDVSINVLPFDSTKKKLFSETVKQVATHETNLDSLYAITNFLKVKEIPEHINKITVIPDSYLYQLPIDILPLEKPSRSYSYGETSYLIEKYNTRYLTSLNEFKTGDEPQTQNSQYQQSFVGYGISNFGNYGKKSLVPLPYAQREVNTIADRLTEITDKKTFINEASTKQAFTQFAPNGRILHLATHSEVSERDPLFSTIYMSTTSKNRDSTFQDQIFAYELFELNLNNEMIMLNSCESGSGSYIQGTGVMGISRALNYAGANSLILNLWSVNDMLASDFAIYFYDQLNKGKSKSEALRDTKQYFLRTKNASPHFWGPYMLIGNTQPVVKPNRNTNLAVAGTFVFYFLLMIGLSYLAERNKLTG